MEINSIQDFANAVKRNTGDLIVIDFYSDSCHYCKKIAPFYESLSKKYPSSKFYKIGYNNNPDIKKLFEVCEVSSYPTFCLFENGKYKSKIVGADENKLETSIINNNNAVAY